MVFKLGHIVTSLISTFTYLFKKVFLKFSFTTEGADSRSRILLSDFKSPEQNKKGSALWIAVPVFESDP